MNNNLQKSEFETTTERYVAFIDIMGFKDMVARSSHNEIYLMMQNIVELREENETVNWGERNTQLVKSTMYSDSIMLCSKDNSFESADSIVSTISALTNDLLCSSIPFKGALAFGLMTLDDKNSIYFGQPLIDAYLLQDELNYYGIVIHSSAESEFEKFSEDIYTLIYDYPCPFKKGSSKHLTIAPLYAGNEDEEDREEYINLVKGVKKFRHKTSGYLRTYIDNTKKYLINYEKSLKL